MTADATHRVGFDDPWAVIEAVVPYAPVTDIAPSELSPFLRRQARGDHPPAWELVPDAGAGPAPAGLWSEFRRGYEHAWTLFPSWQLSRLMTVVLDEPDLAHLSDSGEFLPKDPGALVGDIPSLASDELLPEYDRLERAIAETGTAGAVLVAGEDRFALGAPLTGPVELDPGGQLLLDVEGRVSFLGDEVHGWTLRPDGVELHTASGSGVVDGSLASHLQRYAPGVTDVSLERAPAVQVLQPSLERLWEALGLSSKLRRSVLFVATVVPLLPPAGG
jgi:hypothetical protein